MFVRMFGPTCDPIHAGQYMFGSYALLNNFSLNRRISILPELPGSVLKNQGAAARRIRCQVDVFQFRGGERGGRVAGLRVLVRALSRRGVVVGGRGVVEGGLDPVVLGLVDELGLASKFFAVSSFIVWSRQAMSSLIFFILAMSLASTAASRSFW